MEMQLHYETDVSLAKLQCIVHDRIDIRPDIPSRLCHQRARCRTLVPPGWWQGTDRLVVSGEAVDTGFDQNEAELNALVSSFKNFQRFSAHLGVLVLLVSLEMLANRNGLLDKHVPMKSD